MTMLLYFFLLLVGGESVENRLHFPPLPPTFLRVGGGGWQNRARKGKNGSTFLRVIFVFPFFLPRFPRIYKLYEERDGERKVSYYKGFSFTRRFCRIFSTKSRVGGEGVGNKTSIDNGQAASSSPKPGGGKKTQRFTSHPTPNWECPQHRK